MHWIIKCLPDEDARNVKLENKKDLNFVFSVDDKEYNVTLPEFLSSSSQILVNGKLYHIKFFYNFQNELVKVLINNVAIPVSIQKPTIERPLQEIGEPSSATVKTDLAGKVLKILKEEGSHVKKGEVVIIFESMKMENEIVSPIEGKITSIAVQEGESVLAGNVLFSVEKV